MYCGRKCERRFNYYTSPEERRKLRQQLSEARRQQMHQEGLAQLTLEQLQGEACLTCGTAISQKQGTRRKYCSQKCESQFHYWTSSEQRAEIRQQLDTTSPSRVMYICKCCGAEFEGYKYRRRIYCSRDCNNKSHSYAGSSKQVTTQEIQLSPSSATHRAAMEMRARGATPAEIAKALACNVSTVQGWLRTYEKRLEAPPSHRPFSEPFYRYIHARSAAEWRAVLQDEMQCSPVYAGAEIPPGNTVVLICNTIHARTKLYALAAIADSLGLEPLDGKTYAFCGMQRENLMCLRWDGGGFQLTKRQRDYGRYVWPGEKVGKFIAVTSLEFEFILYGSQQKENPEKR